eukprot:6490753-Amphidinium_carterae.3
MAYVDDLLVVGDCGATQQFLKQFQKHLELKHTTMLTRSTSLEFLGKTIELMDNGTINLCFSSQYFNKILKAYNLEKCKPSTVPGNKKPPIAAEPLDKEQHSMYRTAVGQLLWELSRSLQQPDNEDLKNLKQLLRYIKDAIHYKLTLSPKATYNAKNEIQVDIESFADSDTAGCNTTRKSTSGAITSCWATTLLHISRTQSTIALSSAEAELYARGQATIEAQHIKQVIEEMAIPNVSGHVTMSINTDSSAGKAVASRHVQLRYLYMQDIVQLGAMTISKIPTTNNPADALTKHLPATTITAHLERLRLQTTLTSTIGSLLEVPAVKGLTVGMIGVINNSEQQPTQATEARLGLRLSQAEQYRRRRRNSQDTPRRRKHRAVQQEQLREQQLVQHVSSCENSVDNHIALVVLGTIAVHNHPLSTDSTPQLLWLYNQPLSSS